MKPTSRTSTSLKHPTNPPDHLFKFIFGDTPLVGLKSIQSNNLQSQAACSIKLGNKGRLKALLLTVSNLSQLLQRSALTNYCIDLLATKLFGTSPEKLTSATYPIYHQKTSTVSCQIPLNSLQTLIYVGRDTCS